MWGSHFKVCDYTLWEFRVNWEASLIDGALLSDDTKRTEVEDTRNKRKNAQIEPSVARNDTRNDQRQADNYSDYATVFSNFVIIH